MDFKYKRQIIHQTQPTQTSCVITCIGMLVGLDIAPILHDRGDRRLTHYEMLALLTTHSLFCIPRPSDQMWGGACYIAGVPSRNLPGEDHCIIIDLRTPDENHTGFIPKVYDPAMGFQDKKFYTGEMLLAGEVSFHDLLEVYDATLNPA